MNCAVAIAIPSLTRTSIRLVEGPCSSVGCHLKIPVRGSRLAPSGLFGPRLQVSGFLGFEGELGAQGFQVKMMLGFSLVDQLGHDSHSPPVLES